MYASTWSCGTPLPSAYMQHHESSVYGSNYCGFPSIFSGFERVYASPLRPASHAVEDKHSLPCFWRFTELEMYSGLFNPCGYGES